MAEVTLTQEEIMTLKKLIPSLLNFIDTNRPVNAMHKYQLDTENAVPLLYKLSSEPQVLPTFPEVASEGVSGLDFEDPVLYIEST